MDDGKANYNPENDAENRCVFCFRVVPWNVFCNCTANQPEEHLAARAFNTAQMNRASRGGL